MSQPNKKRHSIAFVLLSLALASLVQAAPGDEIKISADNVELQEAKGVSVYSGNAKLSQGADRINAEKITISHPNQEIESIHIVGSKAKPANLLLHLKGGKKIEGSAQKISYDIASEVLEMRENVHLKQGKNSIKAHSIIYDKRNQTISAQGSSKKRVVTTFEAPQSR